MHGLVEGGRETVMPPARRGFTTVPCGQRPRPCSPGVSGWPHGSASSRGPGAEASSRPTPGRPWSRWWPLSAPGRRQWRGQHSTGPAHAPVGLGLCMSGGWERRQEGGGGSTAGSTAAPAWGSHHVRLRDGSIGAAPGQGRVHHAVLELKLADLDGLVQGGHILGDGHALQLLASAAGGVRDGMTACGGSR